MQVILRRVGASGLYGLVAKLSISISQIAFIPLMIDLFGKKEYGVLVTLISLNSFISLSNFGVSKSMQNKISSLDFDKQQKEILNTYFTSAIFIIKWSAVICAVICSLYLFLNATYNYNITLMLLIFLLSSFLTVQINTVLDYYRGCQRPDIANKISLVISILTITLTAMVLLLELEIHFFYIVVYVVPSLIVLCRFYYKKRKFIIEFSRQSLAGELISFDKVAKLFFCLTIIQFFGFGVDTFLVASYLGAEKAADYNIILRFYNFLLFGFSVFASSLWPFFTKLYSENKIQIIRGLVLKGSIGTVFYGLIASSILCWIVPSFVDDLMNIHIDDSIYVALSFQLMAVVFTSLIIPVLNAMNHLVIQVKFGMANILCNILLSIFLMDIYGVAGTAMATTFSHVVFGVIPLTYYLYRGLRIESSTIF